MAARQAALEENWRTVCFFLRGRGLPKELRAKVCGKVFVFLH